jgi:hypothetical protein
MSTINAPQPLETGDWFQAGTYSLWIFHLTEPEAGDELLVLFEWEIAGLRGLLLHDIWVNADELKEPNEARARSLERELAEPSRFAPLPLAQAIADGDLHRIGRMPAIEGFTAPPYPGLAPPTAEP